jgi:hypothetical protein
MDRKLRDVNEHCSPPSRPFFTTRPKLGLLYDTQMNVVFRSVMKVNANAGAEVWLSTT